MSDTETLFRQEAFDHSQRRLDGEVIIRQSVQASFIAAALVATIAAAGVFLSLGTYSRIETVQGILVTQMPSAKVLAQGQGIVTAFNVVEGTRVRQGQQLGTITLDRMGLNGKQFAAEGLATLDVQKTLADQQGRIARNRSQSERRRLNDIAATAGRQQQILLVQMALQAEIVTSMERTLNQFEPMVQRGYISKTDYERRRQAMLSARQSREVLVQQRIGLQAQAAQARADLDRVDADLERDLTALLVSGQELAQRQTELKAGQAYAIVAPVSGQVTALQTAQGRSVNPGSPLMAIVPERSGLRAELYAPTSAIGFVHPGQEVRLLFDAFPYQRFGSYPATVRSVSQIIMDPRDLDVPLKLESAVYRVVVEPGRQEIIAFGRRLPLQAGMTLQANIILERRSFLDWLLTPLRAVANRT